METEIERLRKKVENFPSASLYNRLAELARQAGDDVDAEAVCRRCIREFPRSGQAYVIIAELKSQQNKKAEALHMLQVGIEKDPRSYAAHRLMADISDDKEKALHHLRQILTFKPNDPSTIERIVELGGTPPTGATSAQYKALPGTAGARPPAGGGMFQSRTPAVSSASPAVRPAVVPTRPVPNQDMDKPLDFPSSGASAPSVAVSQPSAGTVTTMLRSLSGNKHAVLDSLCQEIGVRGAAIVDAQGRVMQAKNLPTGQDELLAALSSDILKAVTATLVSTGAVAPGTWVLGAGGGQVLAFSRDHTVSVVVLADPGVRPAMLELRARQALIDLGAS